jgi:threonine aldolase
MRVAVYAGSQRTQLEHQVARCPRDELLGHRIRAEVEVPAEDRRGEARPELGCPGVTEHGAGGRRCQFDRIALRLAALHARAHTPGGGPGELADPTGFEPAISSVTGWHVWPLHHGSERPRQCSSCERPPHRPVGCGTARPPLLPPGRPLLPPLVYSRAMTASMIDLRSDTVTHPTPAMRRAMYEAEVGDDVFGDDPTVNALEARAAEITGKEAGLFVASGTMGNLVSQMAHVPRGGEIIAATESHPVLHEASGHAVVVGASIRTLPSRPDGTLDPSTIAAAFRDPDDLHEPPTSLVMLENAHGHSMGQALTPQYTNAVAEVAHGRGVPLHIDGARLFNAAVALGLPASQLVEPADSVMFCLSKGLACPVGSMVTGSAAFVARARRARKLVGGGMRQAGILAAAGLVALRDGPEGMIDRLAEDHSNARRLAEALAAMPGIVAFDPNRAATNFVLFGPAPGGDGVRLAPGQLCGRFLDALRERGVLMIGWSASEVRAVTHYGIEASDIDRVVTAARAALADIGAAPRPAVAVR